MFYLIDVFTEVSFRGNPAGVYIVDEFPSKEIMQEMAEFFKFPDLCFVKKMTNNDNKFEIKWFSPYDESPICIHATIAASYVIFSNQLCDKNYIEFHSNTYILKSTFINNAVTISIKEMKIQKCNDICNTQNLLKIEEYSDLYEDDFVYVIVLNSYENLINAKPNFTEISKLHKRAIIVTSPGFANFDFGLRYFAPKIGIYEDPVCGSANCRLASYWSKILKKNQLLSFQPSQRTGIAKLSVKDGIVNISANVIQVAKFSSFF